MAELKDYLDYDPATGLFVWSKDYYKNKAGTSPKASHSEGYLRVQFKKTRFFLHKVAFFWEHGYLPEEVDHIDLNTSNNAITNLRAATHQQNSCNKSTRGFSRYRGVYYHKRNNKWCSIVVSKQQKHYLGSFLSEEAAAEAYNKAAAKYHGEFARLNMVQYVKA